MLRLTQREESSTQELLWCIQAIGAPHGPPAESPANAARRPEEEPCTNVVGAARRLGMRQVRNIALGFTLVTSHRGTTCAAFRYEPFWSHSLAVALSARLLARSLRVISDARVDLSGLLSRVGMLALAQPPPIPKRTAEFSRNRWVCRATSSAASRSEPSASTTPGSHDDDAHGLGVPESMWGSVLAAAHRESAHETRRSEEASDTDPLGSLLELEGSCTC